MLQSFAPPARPAGASGTSSMPPPLVPPKVCSDNPKNTLLTEKDQLIAENKAAALQRRRDRQAAEQLAWESPVFEPGPGLQFFL